MPWLDHDPPKQPTLKGAIQEMKVLQLVSLTIEIMILLITLFTA